MPSIFSRSRTNSSPNKNQTTPNKNSNTLDEFGRVISRVQSRAGPIAAGSGSLPLGKKQDSLRPPVPPKDLRLRTFSTARANSSQSVVDLVSPNEIPDGTFLPLCFDRPTEDNGVKDLDYGYLSHERHIVLGLEQVARLTDVVAAELGTRGGLTTPFIFSSLATDISTSAVKRLISTFVETCKLPNSVDIERKWREEARFSGPHELGMCLRWGLARVVRIVGGQDIRGLIPWEQYVEFRDSEAGP